MTEPVYPLGLFVGHWLPFSETFVYDQILHQRHFRAQVMAKGRTRYADQFPYDRVTALGAVESAWYQLSGRSRCFRRLLGELSPRLLHAHFGTNGVLAVPFAEALDCPLAVTFHGHDVSGMQPRNRYTLRYGRYQLLAGRMLQRADLLLCSSRELAEMLAAQAGAPEHKLRVHHLGVDLGRFYPVQREDAPLRALMVGRMVEKKGMEYGIAAFARVYREFPDARLTIVGDGPLRASLARLARELGVANALRFEGVLSAAEVRSRMNEANVMLAPSVVARDGDRESGLMVLKEAGACGLPSVATRHGGIPEIVVHGETGFLAPERQVEPLSDSLRLLAADPGLRARMGEAALRKVTAEYDTVVQNRKLEEHLLSIL